MRFPGGSRFYLIAPAVTPRVTVRGKTKKKMTAGTRLISAPALVVGASINRSPREAPMIVSGSWWYGRFTDEIKGFG